MKVRVNAPVETSHSHAPPTNSGSTQTVVVSAVVAEIIVDLVVDSVVDSVVEAVDAVYRLMIKKSYL